MDYIHTVPGNRQNQMLDFQPTDGFAFILHYIDNVPTFPYENTLTTRQLIHKQVFLIYTLDIN